MTHKYPALHNAMWPGLVGKGPDSEPPIDLDTMLDMTAATRGRRRQVRRRRSVPLRSAHEHRRRATTSSSGSPTASPGAGWWSARSSRRSGRRPAAAPRWATRRNGSKFLTQVEKACRIGRTLRELGIRKYGVVRIDSSASPGDWAADPAGNTKKIAETFRQAADIAEELRRAARRRRGDLLGRHAQLAAASSSCSRRSAARRPSASRPTWRTRCSSLLGATRPRIGSCPSRLRLDGPGACSTPRSRR